VKGVLNARLCDTNVRANVENIVAMKFGENKVVLGVQRVVNVVRKIFLCSSLKWREMGVNVTRVPG